MALFTPARYRARFIGGRAKGARRSAGRRDERPGGFLSKALQSIVRAAKGGSGSGEESRKGARRERGTGGPSPANEESASS